VDSIPSIEILSATQFETLLAGTEVSSAFALRIWQGTGLLGGTRLGYQELGQRHAGIAKHLIVAIHGVGVVGVAAAEADRQTRYGLSL